MSAPRTFVIGDLHGCADELDCLLDHVAPASADTVVCLGDYIDRGPSARAVVERLLRLDHEGPRCVFLKGNHEDMFLGFLGRHGAYGEAFLRNGGDVTLHSYGLDGLSGAEVAARLPAAHLAFFDHLDLMFEHGPFLCVHAGVLPDRPLDQQRDEDLMWVRGEFVEWPHPFPFTILFGHTPKREVFDDRPYKIGLDTGLVYGNKLSCLELTDLRLFQVRRGGRTVLSRPLETVASHAG